MGTKQEVTFIKGCKGADNKRRTETRHRNFEARRISKSILDGILSGMHNVNQKPSAPCRIIRIKKEENPSIGRKKELITEPNQEQPIPVNKPTSMSSLIIWNVSKALEINPYMDLKGSIRAAKQRLDSDALDLSTMSAQHPEQQHLVCALLAWQQLGHHDADSLYRFIEPKRNEVYNTNCAEKCFPKTNNNDTPQKSIHELIKSTNVHRDPSAPKAFFPKPSVDGSFGSHTSGPVVKLPVETKLIMRLENQLPPVSRQSPKKATKRPEKDTMSKIDAACCLDSECVERLAALDATTNELRSRASKLARREAERVELLERAEAAWKDLEIGYQRRLSLAEEKEEDLNKQIQRLIAERNDFKSTCTSLVVQLKDRGDEVEKARTYLTSVEKQVCDRACVKLRLSEEAAKGEASLAEHQCRAAQYERDLQFKEEQARRKLVLIEHEIDSARVLTCEAERTMRAELSALREQIAQVSNELLQEDEANVRIKEEHDQLRQEKMEMVEDLEGCKVMCDLRMQGRVDELMKKKEMLNGAREQALECRCNVPVDETVQVKRTPSLVAMCRCAPEDKLLESCSCTSLRSRLLSNLLADLFGGLQTELGGSGSQMPCQLLKCLEDKHNWDRASIIKTNLRNYFSKLLMGELDIAIATSIENYHAKWVGASCADVAKMVPDLEDDLKEGWQQRALERRAQKMATQLAEQLFQERAEQLVQRAKEIVTSGPPPCECRPPKSEAAAYPCLMPPNSPFGPGTLVINRQSGESSTPAFWKRTIQDVTQLRLQIEDLKKDSIKKEDLKLMEEKIFKVVKQAAVIEDDDPPTIVKDTSNFNGASIKKETKILRTPNKDESPKISTQNKSGGTRKKALDNNSFLKKTSIYEKPTKQSKKQVHGQSYAVNLCLCGIQKNSKNLQNAQSNNEVKSSWKQKPLRDTIPQNSIVKQTKPINIHLVTPELDENGSKTSELCNSNCKCFRKVPSNTSIDKLLQTLAKWKCDLEDPQEKCIKNIKSSLSKYSKTAIKESMHTSNQNDSKINLSISTASNKQQVNESDIYKFTHMETDKQQRKFKQPVTTESEYMGAVYLDKSNENTCKCIPNIESDKENNQEKYENGNKNIPFKCINTNVCECKIYQEMQKDHKRSQTEEFYKVEIQSNQCQVVQTKDIPESNKNSTSKSSDYINSRQEMKCRSDMNNVPQKTELFPSSCEYYIKFLGVTLDDLSSNKKTTKILKDVDHNANDLLILKDKYVERRTIPKKLSDMEPSNSLTKPNVVSRENDQSGFEKDSTKCECNAQFEEFKSFMNNYFANKLHNTHKDEGHDSQSFKYTENTIESCVCCNRFNVDDSRDLEVNAFHLLEDHLKGKLEEFKLFSCTSACIPPEEEEKLFSAILKRVKQVISDCANEMKCGCPGGLQNNGSWNRAYGLLQEYLKIKIKRVQCLCVLNDNKDVVLPDILEKVCNLIETDFQRLKNICKCKNSTEIRKKCVRIEDLVLPRNKELPEKDTNISQVKYDDAEIQNFSVVKKLSKQNSNNSMILTENISSQVPANLGMEAKSCDIMVLDNKNVQTTETDRIITNSKSHGVMYNKCDCCHNTDKVDIHQFPDMFRTKEVLVNLYTDEVIDTNDICELPRIDIDQGQATRVSVGRVDIMKPIPKIEMSETDESKLDKQKHFVVNEQTPRVPYIGYTVDCNCDDTLGSCVCMKSVVQANNYKIDSLWKGFLINNNNNQNFSYIMNGTQNKNSDNVVNSYTSPDVVVLIDDIPKASVQNDDKPTCETEVDVKNEDDIILKHSIENVNSINHTTNTFDENLSLGSPYSNSENPLDWFECPGLVNFGRANAVKLANSIYFPGSPIDNYKKFSISNTVTDTDTQKTPQTCNCNKVPICHVKMLVENIEKNLIESKCTCDSLISKVCPVHSKRAC